MNTTDAGNMTREPPRANILLLGAGSVGAVWLYQLQKAGCAVTAVCRSNFAAVRETGFKLSSVQFGDVSYRPDHTIQNVSEMEGTVDYVLVCTKANPGAKPFLVDILRPVLENNPATAIVLAQNGIMIEEEVAAAFPTNPLLSGVVYLPARQTGPGTVEHTGMLNRLELGTYPADAPAHHKTAAESFAALMRLGGGEVEVHSDIQISRWTKLLWNGTWNPICALTMCTDGGFLTTSSPFAQELAWDTMLEIVSLAQKVGVPQVTEAIARERFQFAQTRADTKTGREMSMLQDVRQSRPLEVEVILGNAVRIARQHALRLPRLETLYALASARNVALIENNHSRA